MLSSNKLTTLPKSIGCLTNLTRLHLSKNQLRYLPDSVCKLTNLESLELSANKLRRVSVWSWGVGG